MAKETRLYGLFELNAEGKWVRLYPTLSLKKSHAVKVFQSALLAHFLGGAPERRLRPVKE